jgi:hypothetical protein
MLTHTDARRLALDALIRLREGSMLYEGSIKALLRLYKGALEFAPAGDTEATN